MVKKKKLTVSASPHLRSPSTASGIMLDVIIALIPALIAGVAMFGWRVLAVCGVSVASAVLTEFVVRKIMRRSTTIGDFSAVVTGLILAFNLPATIPLWIAALGAVIAIAFVKQAFGGIGQNFVNPAIGARIILIVSFPAAMSDWAAPLAWRGIDAATGATPLAVLKGAEGELPGLFNMFFGARPGSLGEVCAIALLIGGLYLLMRRVISPAIPLSFIGTVAVIMLIYYKGDFGSVAYQLLAGGLLLGAIFMATDYSTSPINLKGKIIFGIGCGIFTCVIRLFGSLPEGVSFAILLMNILVPHIENLTTPKPFGTPKESRRKGAEA